MNETDWLTLSGTTARLTLHIQPGAKKTAVAGPHGDALKIRLAAPPVDGKANAALLAVAQLATHDAELAAKLDAFRQKQTDKVLAMQLEGAP